jgi:DNA-binding NarL/FixJ family response regulator
VSERSDRLRVLVVENSKVLVGRLIERLEAVANVIVVGIADAAATAIEQIDRLRPDVLIVDIALASGTGFDVLRALRRRGGSDSPTAIMFTNHSSPPYRDAAARLGAAHFFDKNHDFVRLVELIRSFAERRGARSGFEG